MRWRHNWQTAREPGDEVAITTLLKAAEALGTTDPGAAADLASAPWNSPHRRHPLRGPLVAQTAVWLHAAGRGEEAKAFADTALHQTFPAEQEAEVRISVAGMFAISPDVRAEECRQALALPGLPAPLRARHLALLVPQPGDSGPLGRCPSHARRGSRRGPEQRRRTAGDLHWNWPSQVSCTPTGSSPAALEMVETALRTGLRTGDDTRSHLTYQWRCDVLTMVDRLDESLELSTEAVASAQRDRQGWALGIFETGRGRQLLQMGRLADAAAALEGQLAVEMAPQIVSVLDAAGVVALGRVAIHMGDPDLSRQAREIAHVMLGQSVPSVRRHAAWLLALQEMAGGDAARAHEWLCALGDGERLSIVPLFPMDVADEARLVHIAVAAKDDELASHAVQCGRGRARLNPQVRSIAGGRSPR